LTKSLITWKPKHFIRGPLLKQQLSSSTLVIKQAHTHKEGQHKQGEVWTTCTQSFHCYYTAKTGCRRETFIKAQWNSGRLAKYYLACRAHYLPQGPWQSTKK